MIRIYFTAVILTIVLISCSDNKEFSQFKTIKTAEKISEPLIEELINIKDIIALETNKDCLIGIIQKIEVYNDTIFILDYDNKTLFAFSVFDGSFIFKIRSVGKGPGEYISLYDFIIDEYEHNIKILGRGKILTFNLGGKFITEKRLDFAPTKIERLNKNTYCLWSGSNSVLKTHYYTLHYIDNKFSVQESFLKDTTSRIFDSPKMFYKSNNETYLRPNRFSSSIYSLLGDKPQLNYKIDFNGKWIKRSSNKNIINQQIQNGAFYKIRNFYLANDLVYFTCVRKGLIYRTINYSNPHNSIMWSKASEKSIFRLTPFNVDEFYNDMVYWHIEPMNLKEQIQNLERRGIYSEVADRFDIKSKLSSTNLINSNPFIVKYEFKNIE
ncbi:6-bladed beta-propeller [Saccharicrinis sp. FJH2]|uniref:6-bladed beta-propeller n=1 Tax=Saccharicrinis sp. FJH65 TaxID=3344659 RepID=UPI0035F48E1F